MSTMQKPGLPKLSRLSKWLPVILVAAAAPATWAAADHLLVTTSAQTLRVGELSQTITVELRDTAGSTVLAGAPVYVMLSGNSSGVAFFRDNDNAANVTYVLIGPGWSSASFRYKDFAPGTAKITAADRAGLLAAATQDETILKGDTTLQLFSSANPANTGDTVKFTALVKAVAPAVAMPGGAVTFSVDGVAQAPVALAGGQAVLSLSALAAGEHAFTAAYNGDGRFNAGAADELAQVIQDDGAGGISRDSSGSGQALQFVSPPIATPSIVKVGEVVSFSAAGSGPDGDVLTYAWDFADGTTGESPSVTHAFSATGIYNVVVTLQDGAASTTARIIVVVMPDNGLQLKSAVLKFNFANPQAGSFTSTGMMPVPAGFNPAGKVFTVGLGEPSTANYLSLSFVLNAKGAAATEFGTIKLSGKFPLLASSGQPVKFSVALKNVDLLTPLQTFGLVNKTVSRSVDLPFFMGLSYSYQDTLTLAYQARQNVKGVARRSVK